jgi:hypothetical protein
MAEKRPRNGERSAGVGDLTTWLGPISQAKLYAPMRRLLALFACSVLVPLGACEKHVIVNPVPVVGTDEPAASAPPAASVPATDPLVMNLGTIDSGVDVPFSIPPGALGFNIIIEGTVADFDQDAPYGIETITDPTGKVVHDAFTPRGGTSVTSTATFDTIAAASIPQGEGTAPIPGTWKVKVGVQNAPTKKVKVTGHIRVQSSSDGVFHGGRLDLHLHVPDGLKVGATTVMGATAKDSPDLNTRVTNYFAVLSQLLGIEKGDVVFHPAEAALASVDGSEELVHGFAASSGAKDGSQEMHILLTNQISLGGKPIAAGIAPGIPGAATIFGRGVSTIIIATSQSADSDALTMVHETGHFFGLNHTTEFSGAGADPLLDTPKCTTLVGEPTFAEMKTCPDRTNIMFPATAIDTPITLSAEQKAVYRGSPIYKAFLSGPQKTTELEPMAMPVLKPFFRVSNGPLSALEQELSLGFCGLNKLDPLGMLKRYGTTAIAQLRAAEADEDLSPIIRGRASIALDQLNAR